jgi:hypothetical protein
LSRIKTKKSKTQTTSSGKSNSNAEIQTVIIPPNALSNLSEFVVSKDFFNTCDISKYPSRKGTKTLKFDKSTSPFVFYNSISYVYKGDTSRIETKFYISEITNLPESEVFKTCNSKNCKEETSNQIKIAKIFSPDKFFITYKLGKETYSDY